MSCFSPLVSSTYLSGKSSCRSRVDRVSQEGFVILVGLFLGRKPVHPLLRLPVAVGCLQERRCGLQYSPPVPGVGRGTPAWPFPPEAPVFMASGGGVFSSNTFILAAVSWAGDTRSTQRGRNQRLSPRAMLWRLDGSEGKAAGVLPGSLTFCGVYPHKLK